ncbi:MAG TPA: 7TM-DISM domain-containing protein [Oligoflexus sp.]|uniref:7TM-DISM domain-containing protein n=1 Tax=Oligoflexus sp. TaxID=1971216 RepID=UPI002D80C814|nr:7TM-DISM domain-containing protein [Oligoflexus sp.]HET9238254.1 7TM-DISM domain-containing protein [Oligoflexus sp.]
MRYLLGLLLFLNSVSVWAQSPITDVNMLDVPAGTLTHEDFAEKSSALNWHKTSNGAGFLARPQRDYYVSFEAPQGDAEGYLLHLPFRMGGVDGTEYTFQLFVLEHSNLRPVPLREHRFATFVVDPSLYGKQLLLKCRTGPFATASNLDLRLFKPQDLERKTQEDLFFLGIVNGVIGIMSIYNIGLLLLFRKSYLFYYGLYTLAALYWFNLASGLFWYNTFMILSFHMSVEAIHVATILFSFRVLQAREYFPRLYQLSRCMIVISLLLLATMLLGMERSIYLYYAMIPGSFLLCFILAVKAARMGDRSAYPMLLGWAGLCLGVIISSLPAFMEHAPILEWAAPIAISFEIATFSFAMGQKMRTSELSFQRENEHAFAEMRKMIYPHQLERVRKGEHLEDTMPTHPDQALVISFDIIGSSKLKDKSARMLFREVFARCNEMMLEGYDGSGLKSRAYRIKEMGDGFLCSVGYPFAALSPNPAREAVVLAQRFADVLAEVVQTMKFQEKVACGIGIAWDTITGFYPEAGAKEYDLYGRAIVLATRYEGMRKALFDGKREQSLLILQDKVAAALDPHEMQGFEVIELAAQGLVVRDDPTATRLYVKWLSGYPMWQIA